MTIPTTGELFIQSKNSKCLRQSFQRGGPFLGQKYNQTFPNACSASLMTCIWHLCHTLVNLDCLATTLLSGKPVLTRFIDFYDFPTYSVLYFLSLPFFPITSMSKALPKDDGTEFLDQLIDLMLLEEFNKGPKS